jgi:hypothetical protein
MILASIGAAAVIGITVMVALNFETAHDRDLRECRQGYAIATRYSEPSIKAYSADLVEACMRGRGY